MNRHRLDVHDFEDGWFPGTYKDVSDFEWTVLRTAFKDHFLWFLGHCLFSQLIAQFIPQVSG